MSLIGKSKCSFLINWQNAMVSAKIAGALSGYRGDGTCDDNGFTVAGLQIPGVQWVSALLLELSKCRHTYRRGFCEEVFKLVRSQPVFKNGHDRVVIKVAKVFTFR